MRSLGIGCYLLWRRGSKLQLPPRRVRATRRGRDATPDRSEAAVRKWDGGRSSPGDGNSGRQWLQLIPARSTAGGSWPGSLNGAEETAGQVSDLRRSTSTQEPRQIEGLRLPYRTWTCTPPASSFPPVASAPGGKPLPAPHARMAPRAADPASQNVGENDPTGGGRYAAAASEPSRSGARSNRYSQIASPHVAERPSTGPVMALAAISIALLPTPSCTAARAAST